jgi:ubiquinone/menaquinone biosynthesis C-methylase UbiE
MSQDRQIDDFEMKKANIMYHDVESAFFENAHPELAGFYERVKVSKSILFIVANSSSKDICIDIGCGTGFVTGFEMPFYKMVIATDISSEMLKIVKHRFDNQDSLNLVICDVDFLPFKNSIADLVSVSSVLHHLPKPFTSIGEVSRVLKRGGFVYITREPNFQRFSRFFSFFDQAVVRRLLKILRLSLKSKEVYSKIVGVNGVSHLKVHSYYPTGFHLMQLLEALLSKGFEILDAYSYHWIFSNSRKGRFQNLLTRSNFLVEKIPLSNRFGRYVSVIARKLD